MKPYLQDSDFTLYNGDALDVLRELPDESVDCVVTSPPYWGLRDYGTGEWEGGDERCDHKADVGASGSSGLNGSLAHKSGEVFVPFRVTCGKCGARRSDRQLGLEPTPEEYVANMTEVFREVRRVLASHGTLWLNMGDSYAAARSYQVRDNKHTEVGNNMAAEVPPGLKPKDLCGLPWRLAFALQADGWYLRSDIVWSKPNPMPESVTDRPTKAHEYVFLLTKQPRYFFDQEAVREPYNERWVESHYRYMKGNVDTQSNRKTGRGGGPGIQGYVAPGVVPRPPTDSLLDTPQRRANFRSSAAERQRQYQEEADAAQAGRNIRSVWEIATEPFPEAHFATFPQALVERCLKAGTREGETVIDPFIGSGTVAFVARRLGRRCVGIELNEDYCKMIAKRTQQLSLLGAVT